LRGEQLKLSPLRASKPAQGVVMDQVADKIIEILRKNMRDPAKEITLDTKLADLEIESLDLAVIVFDIEDSFGIQIPYNANEEVQDFATVGSVVERVKTILAESRTSDAAA
jgi:nodulation protein F